MSEFWVVLFPNNTSAMRAERVLDAADIKGRLVPVPRHFSCRCGVALRLERDTVSRALAALKAARVPVSAVHAMR